MINIIAYYVLPNEPGRSDIRTLKSPSDDLFRRSFSTSESLFLDKLDGHDQKDWKCACGTKMWKVLTCFRSKLTNTLTDHPLKACWDLRHFTIVPERTYWTQSLARLFQCGKVPKFKTIWKFKHYETMKKALTMALPFDPSSWLSMTILEKLTMPSSSSMCRQVIHKMPASLGTSKGSNGHFNLKWRIDVLLALQPQSIGNSCWFLQ